jgi:hypothetical protein
MPKDHLQGLHRRGFHKTVAAIVPGISRLISSAWTKPIPVTADSYLPVARELIEAWQLDCVLGV